jgi:SAM-dependent methyltransferase
VPPPERHAAEGDIGATTRCRMCGSGDLRSAASVGGFDFAECRSCEFVFAPQMTDTTLERAYAGGWHGVREGAPPAGWASRAFLQPAFSRLGPPRRLDVLDFGAGDSTLPSQLRQAGHRCVGVDVMPPARPHPDRLTGRLHELPLPEHRFDLAYSYQVFEHLPEPRPYLDRLLELVKEDGLLLLHTDMETCERDPFEDWWYVTPPDHCAFFRHRTFDRYLERTPYRIEWRDAKSVLIRRR